MYNLFDYLFSIEGTEIYYTLIFWHICAALVASVLFVISLIAAIKTKKRWLTISSVGLFLFIYFALPSYFEHRAIQKAAGITYSEIANNNYGNMNNYIENYLDNIKIVNKNREIAAKLSVFPAQKGFIYLTLGQLNIQDNPGTSKKYYEKAYKYLKTYESKQWLIPMVDYYTYIGDFDKTIEIAEAHNDYQTMARSYIMKKDYKKALEALSKTKTHGYNYMLIGNIYQNLGKNAKAEIYYQAGLKSVKNSHPQVKQMYEDMYNDKDYTQHKWESVQANYRKSLQEKQSASANK